MTREAHVSVLIETEAGAVIYRNWTGASIQGIHRAARKQYAREFPGARVSFGAGYYVNSYGAH